MDPVVKLNNTGKVTAGSIVSFNYKGEQKTGIVYATNSSHNVYRVKHISNDPKKRGMIDTVELAGKDFIDTMSLIENLRDDHDVYYALEKINKLTSSIKDSRRTTMTQRTSSKSPSRRTSSKSPSRRTSSKSPSRTTQRTTQRMTPAERISARYGGSRKTRRNRRHRK